MCSLTVPGGVETRYSCCENAVGSSGCQVFNVFWFVLELYSYSYTQALSEGLKTFHLLCLHSFCHDFSLNWVFNSDIVAFYQANNLIFHFQWLQLKRSLYVLMYMFTASCPWCSKSSGLCEQSSSIFSGQNMSRSLCCWHTNSKA